MEDSKTIHEHARAMYTETRENLKKSMDRINSAIPLQQKDEKHDLQAALKIKSEFSKVKVEDDECMKEAAELRKVLMEQRAKCIASGFPSAAKVFTESIEAVNKMMSTYEKAKRAV